MPASTVRPVDVNYEVNLPVTYEPIRENIKYEDVYGYATADPKAVRNTDLAPLAQEWVDSLNTVLDTKGDYSSIHKIFAPHASWRDHLCLSWEFHQFHDADLIAENLQKRQPEFQVKDFEIDAGYDNRFPSGVTLVTVHGPESTDDGIPIEWVQVYLKFTNKYGSGKGIARLISTSEGLKAYTVYTVLDQLYGSEEKLSARRPRGVNHGQTVNRQSWAEKRAGDSKFGEGREPPVLIIGGGQSGLNMAARLKIMGLESLIIEANDRIGDNWRKRYSFLVLHDPIWADHLAYLNFPDIWPIYTPKDKLANWFEYYADALELNVWNGKIVKHSTFDPETKSWECEILDLKTNEITKLKPKHLIMGTGHSGEPNIPHFKGEEDFKGVLLHSSQHKTGKVFQGENALVVGSCNSAHDIAQDFYEQGAKVTMLQRSSTCIMNVDKGSKLNLAGLYEPNGPADVNVADMLNFSTPIKLTNMIQQQAVRKTYDIEKEMIDKLTAKNFKLDYGFGSTGMYGKYFRRGGGYYIDVGGSALIAEDKIKMKQGVEVDHFTEHGVVFSDGSKLDNVAIVVLATGYANMKTTAKTIVDEEVYSKLVPVWGLNEEGELNGVFTNSGHENFWYAGGNLTITRYFSKLLAMRIIAQERGLTA